MLANWKTTLAGLVAAVAHVSINGVSWKNLLVAAALAALGYFTQDAKKPAPAK